MKRLFCVQPYRSKGHRLVADGATLFEEEADAAAAGRRLVRFRAGVVVLEQVVNGRTGALSRPRVIALHGNVPACWRETAVLFDAA